VVASEWWNQLNNYAQLMPQAPALAAYWATNGPNPDIMGYDLAGQLQQTSAKIAVYPDAMPGG
jgi:hypothetical protein